MSFQIGPSMGALVPVQDEGDPWRTSFVFGLKARYEAEPVDVDAELQFTQLGIDPDSSRGYDYSMVLLTAGASRTMAGVRWGLGASLYPIEARKEIGEETDAVWSGTFPGMYVLVGKDSGLPLGLAPRAGFDLILAHGYLGIARQECGQGREQYDLAMLAFEEGIAEYPDRADDYAFGISQLQTAQAAVSER